MPPPGDQPGEHIPIGGSGNYAGTGGGEGGATTLTELSDVTGEPGVGKAPVYDDSGVAPLTEVTTQEDLDAILEQVAHVERHYIGQPGEPPFLSQFRNIGEPWAPACYRQLANGTVRLEGTIMCQDDTIATATWVPIFALPAELAPIAPLEFSAATNDEGLLSKILVWNDGQVLWGGYYSPPRNPVSRLPLNAISWSVR